MGSIAERAKQLALYAIVPAMMIPHGQSEKRTSGWQARCRACHPDVRFIAIHSRIDRALQGPLNTV